MIWIEIRLILILITILINSMGIRHWVMLRIYFIFRSEFIKIESFLIWHCIDLIQIIFRTRKLNVVLSFLFRFISQISLFFILIEIMDTLIFAFRVAMKTSCLWFVFFKTWVYTICLMFFILFEEMFWYSLIF